MEKKRYGLEKIITTIVLGGMLTGCASTHYIGGKRDEGRDYATSAQIIQPQVYKKHPDPTSMDELLSNLTTLGTHIEKDICIGSYKPHLDQINRDVEEKRYEHVQKKVRSLAQALQDKDDACSKQLAENLRRFTYQKHEYVGDKYQLTKRASRDPIRYVESAISIGFSAVSAPFKVLRGDLNNVSGNIVKPTQTKRKKVDDAYYRIIEVNPYRGTQKEIGTKPIR